MGEQEYPQIVREALVEVERRRKRVLEVLLPAARVAERLKEAFPGLNVFRGATNNGIYVYADASNREDVLRFLAERGYPTGKPVEYGSKQLRWGADPFEVWTTNAVPGPNCRWVKTGERTEPVYELVCDEAERAKAMGLEPVGGE